MTSKNRCYQNFEFLTESIFIDPQTFENRMFYLHLFLVKPGSSLKPGPVSQRDCVVIVTVTKELSLLTEKADVIKLYGEHF